MRDEHQPANDTSAEQRRKMIDAARQQVEQAQQQTDTHAASDGARLGAADSSAGQQLPPDSFPGYEIVREIHRGGQGVVYLAQQTSTRRAVAIKVIREGPFAGQHDQARFKQEVRILGQLNHPAIVTIHDSGLAAGSAYFVMDYIPGQPLDAYVADEKPSVAALLELFATICDAISAAHVSGVIHRDLKPNNIRIATDGRPNVLDFGLAKIAVDQPREPAQPQTMTATGQFVGSLPWASPEQAAGLPARIDVRSDVYALGVIMYQMLTGRFPYPVTGSIRDVLDHIQNAPPTRPSTITRQINDEIETIVLKCLSKDPERRYQSAGELARDVRRYLNGEAIEAKRDSGWYVLCKTLRRYKMQSTIAVLFLLFGMATGIGLAALYQQAVVARREAEEQARIAWTQAENAAAILQQMTAEIDSQDAPDVAGVPVQPRLAGDDPDQRYFLIGPRPGAPPPPHGYRLLIVLPGGDGSADFLPYVRRIFSHALPDGYLLAQPTAKAWTAQQFEQLVWPTRQNPWPDMRYSTEDFVEAVIEDIRQTHPVDARYVFALGWSSGGPPTYALSLQESTPITGACIAMSTFRLSTLPERADCAGRRFVLLHSPDDRLIPIEAAQRARDELHRRGANVTLIEYPGGHGWHGDVYGNIRRAIRLLEGRPSTAEMELRIGPAAPQQPTAHVGNLLRNGGFEEGLAIWQVRDDSDQLNVSVDKTAVCAERQSLRITKPGTASSATLRDDASPLPTSGSVTVSAAIKADQVGEAWLRFVFYDRAGAVLTPVADIARLHGTFDWTEFEDTFDVPPAAHSAAVLFVMMRDGTAWLDDVSVKPE
ncbi:MAG: protein kinase [Planctomycetes bacterium]|nr:protein kinase [Planctomycetota bacterium]